MKKSKININDYYCKTCKKFRAEVGDYKRKYKAQISCNVCRTSKE